MNVSTTKTRSGFTPALSAGVMLLLVLLTSRAFSAKTGVPVTVEFHDAPITVVLQALADYQIGRAHV